ncbi:hypothetical protein OG698_10615 [Streptomyces sp. NBC_01003]|uniref:hypothetical protein n=1 Tax=Streptomyces sp. NBC_01003 TaxID=2903714 RepID=UPI0038633A33|nr:hypothetical protein OG698_10615 [Streptomyces sp. NBC_01003]
MNITEFLTDLRARHDEATARAGELRGQIEDLTAALTENEARLADLATIESQHPNQAFRVRDLHELLGMPTDEPCMNVTRSRFGRLTRQGFLNQPGRARYQKRT